MRALRRHFAIQASEAMGRIWEHTFYVNVQGSSEA